MHSVQVKEKREHPRFEVKWPITMMSIDGDAYGEIENISAGGAYVRCGKPLSEDDDLVMGILGLDRELLWLGARVVRTDVKLTAEGVAEAIGVGVRFTRISTEDLQILNRVVLESEKQATP